MKVSIAFTTFNHEKFVAAGLRSALTQDYPEYELVVHDDGSKDATPQIIAEILAKEVPPHVTVVVAGDGTNHGLHEAINRATKACTGDVVMMISGDDISHASRLRKHVAIYEKFPEVMLVSSVVNQVDQDGNRTQRPRHSISDRQYSYAEITNTVYANSPVLGAAMSCRAEVFKVFCPLRSSHSYAEDNVCWVRALLLGKVYYLGEALLEYRLHPGNESVNMSHWGNQISELARSRSLEHMRREGLNFKQWELDINRALELHIISKSLARKIKRTAKIVALRSEVQYLSLRISPWREWFSSAMGLIKLGRIDLWAIRFALRLSPRLRARYWAWRQNLMKARLKAATDAGS